MEKHTRPIIRLGPDAISWSSLRLPWRVLAVLWPITAFVALGFEHSIANMFLIPLGMLAGDGLDLAALFANLLPVTLGNIVGGGVLVAAVYWLVYRHGAQ